MSDRHHEAWVLPESERARLFPWVFAAVTPWLNHYEDRVPEIEALRAALDLGMQWSRGEASADDVRWAAMQVNRVARATLYDPVIHHLVRACAQGLGVVNLAIHGSSVTFYLRKVAEGDSGGGFAEDHSHEDAAWAAERDRLDSLCPPDLRDLIWGRVPPAAR